MTAFRPLRRLPSPHQFNQNDALVVFGELFARGYANGLVEAAEQAGMRVIYSTVGRRDESGLRKLNSEELAAASQPLLNVPLEAGFDLTVDKNGKTPCDQLGGLRLNDWMTAKMNWDSIQQSKETAKKDFRSRVQEWAHQLQSQVGDRRNLVIAHTMAGGVPRAKIIMPAMNRVFKGYGERYASSEEFWQTDLGRFCAENFMEVTAETFRVLIEETQSIREMIESRGGKVTYTAYGYHGTDVLVGSDYQWQSYAPYLQGFAKIKLEQIAEEFWKKGIKATVFNAPEILTNSSSVFLGIEVPLYPLLLALDKEAGTNPNAKNKVQELLKHFKDGFQLSELKNFTLEYFNSDVIKRWSIFEKWPQHNGPEQMEMIKKSSTYLFSLQKDEKDPVTTPLSEIVFTACGDIMLASAHSPESPVWWLGHDIVAQSTLVRWTQNK